MRGHSLGYNYANTPGKTWEWVALRFYFLFEYNPYIYEARSMGTLFLSALVSFEGDATSTIAIS